MAEATAFSKPRQTPRPRHAVVVLGQPPSTVRALAAVMAQLGCDLPRSLDAADPLHPQASVTSAGVAALNAAVLAAAGDAQDEGQVVAASLTAPAQDAELLHRGAGVLAEDFGTSRLFVLADTQTTTRIGLLVPFWLRVFAKAGVTPVFLLVHHHPAAAGMAQRAGGHGLWLRHALDSEAATRSAARHFTRHDRLPADWEGLAAALQSRHGLSFPRFSHSVSAGIDAFLGSLPQVVPDAEPPAEPDAEPARMAQWAATVSGILDRWAVTDEQPPDHATLDRIRAEVDATAPLARPARQSAPPGGTRPPAAAPQVPDAAAPPSGARGDAPAQVLAAAQDDTARLRADLARQQGFLDALLGEKAALAARLDAQAAALAGAQQDTGRLRHEAEDLRRRQAEALETLAAQAAAITALTAERDALAAEQQQTRKSIRLMRVRMEEQMRAELVEALAGSRAVMGKRFATLNEEKLALKAEVARLAAALKQEKARAAALEKRAAPRKGPQAADARPPAPEKPAAAAPAPDQRGAAGSGSA
jgi:hypothetical protein